MSGAVRLDLAALFAPVAGEEKLGLAVSGGPDSLALMLLAAEWSRGNGVALVVYTVDHGLRPEARDEAAVVVREAERLGLKARSLRWSGPHPLMGIQAAARSARYRLMAEAMASDGVAILATAHHLADQAETVLMRLAHGSGIEGLRGMDRINVVEDCEIFRPLLGIHPATLRDIVAEAGLTPALDPSNDDESYERVRWRKLLPALEALGLGIDRLGTLARRMDEASSLVDGAVEAEWPQIVTPVTGVHFEITHGRFAALNPLVGTRLLGQVLQLASEDRRSPPLSALEALQQQLQWFEPLKAVTLHGCVIESDGETIAVRREKPRTASLKAALKETAN